MRIFTGKRAVVLGAVIGLSLGAGGLAFAYFTGTGTGTGQGLTGSPGTWTVGSPVESGTIYPGQGTETITYTVTNKGSGNQAITGATATVVSKNNDITQGGTELSMCLSAWYNAVVSTTFPSASVAPNGTTTVVVTVNMLDASANQDVCMGAQPDISLSVS